MNFWMLLWMDFFVLDKKIRRFRPPLWFFSAFLLNEGCFCWKMFFESNYYAIINNPVENGLVPSQDAAEQRGVEAFRRGEPALHLSHCDLRRESTQQTCSIFLFINQGSEKRTYLVFAGGAEQGQPTGHWAKHVKRADQSRANGDVFVTVSLLAHSYYKKINQSIDR